MNGGFYKKWRKQEDSAFWSMGLAYRGLWETILHNANWKPGWFLGRKLVPGQFATSLENLATDGGIGVHSLRIMLDKMEHEWKMITRENWANRCTVITVCNWERYNGEDSTDGQTEGRPAANHGQTEGRLRATIEEGKKGRREEQGNASAPESVVIHKPPTLKDCIATGTVAGIPEQFSRDWHDMMQAQGWRDNNGRPCAFRWRNLLKRYYETEKANPTAPKTGGLFA